MTDDREVLGCCDLCGAEILDGDQFTIDNNSMHWCLACLDDCQEYALRMWQEAIDEAIPVHEKPFAEPYPDDDPDREPLTELYRDIQQSEGTDIMIDRARKLGNHAADAYAEEFGISPAEDGPEHVGDWDSSAWELHWKELKDAEATEADYADCLQAWRAGFLV
jgi:NAD-dependent dihydropyrimidine dehydrogenase PreA subunit